MCTNDKDRGTVLSTDEEKEQKWRSKEEAEDRKLALELQRREEEVAREASEKQMTKSTDGKAVLAVQDIIAAVKNAKERFISNDPVLKGSIEAVTIDDMVFMAKSMLQKQKEFIDKQIPGHIDIGYHYTDQRNLVHIRTHGLLTKAERKENKVLSTKQNASVFGDGIYTANNETNFSKYGDTGLIVARLKGKIVRVCESLLPNEKVDANTIIGDKLEKPESQTLQDSDGWPIEDSYYEIVLRSSLQCLPMVKFDKALIGHNAGIECIRFLRNSLELILNERFNEGLLVSDLCNTPLIGNATTVPAFGSSYPQFNISRGRRTIGMAGGQPAQQMTTTQLVLWGPQQTIGTTRSAYAGTTGAFGSNPSPFGGVATGSVFGGGNVSNAAPFSIGQPSAGAAFVQATGSTKLRGRPNSDILASFYQTYNPSKVNQVGTILRKYAGREKQMFLALSKKYKVDPSMFGVSAAQPKAMGFGNSAGFGVATPGTGFGSSTGGFGLIAQTGGFSALASSTATGFGGSTSTQSSSFGPTASSSATNPTHNTMPVVKIDYFAPQSLSKSFSTNALIAPPLFCNMDDDCVICHERLKTSSCVALKVCNHVFHRDCIQMAFQSKSQCPTCRVPVGAPQGKSPSGTMSVSVNPVRCSGFQCDTMVISYNIPAARQLSYHDNPGATHGSKVATAYVPNNEDGVNLLKRLKFAFKHGLTFTVGTSMTSRKTDQCTWSSIHHKTSPSGGTQSHGFPDPEYFRNCNGELDGVSVPSARALDDDGRIIMTSTKKASQPCSGFPPNTPPTFSFTSSSLFAPTASTFGTSFAFGNAKWAFNSSSKPPDPSSAMPLAPLVTLGPSSQSKELDELKTKLAATESDNVVLQDKKQASDEACQRLRVDMKTAKEEFSKELDELMRKLALREGENLVLQDKLHACDAKIAEVQFSKEFDEMKRKLVVTEFENVALRDKVRDMVEAYQKVQNHMNATGALIHNVVKSEAWAAYKTTTVMDGTNMVVLHAITAMSQYEQKSFEELRLEYYNKASNISGTPSGEREEITLGSAKAGALRGNLIATTFLGVFEWVTVILLILVDWFKDYLSQ